MKNTLLYIILCLVLAPVILFSQAYTITNYNRENGLPNNYIYSLISDQTGLLWIATETGLCTFNGSTFNLNPIPELMDEEIVGLYLDKKNRLWFLGLSGRAHILKDGKLSAFQNEYIQNQVIKITEDPIGNIWIKGIRDDDKEIAFDTDSLALKHYPKSKAEGLQVLQEILGKTVRFEQLLHLEEDAIVYEHLGVKTKFKSKSILNFFKDLLPLNENNWIFRIENRFYHFNGHTGKLEQVLSEYNEEFDMGVGGMTIDKFNNLWIAKRFGVLMIKDILSPKPEVSRFLEDVRIGECHADINGMLWINTLKSGLYTLRPTSVKTSANSRKECVTSIYKNKDYLVYGTLDGEVVILDKQLEEVRRIKVKDKRPKIYKIEAYGENKILAVSSTVIALIDLTDFRVSDLLLNGFNKNATLNKFETIWINGGSRNYIYNNKTKDLAITDLDKRSYSCLPLNEDAALFGTINGLYKVTKSNDVQKMLGLNFNKDIRHISKKSESSFFLSTHAEGIFIMENDSIVDHLLDHLPSQNIRKAIYIDSVLWVASNNGLTKVLLDDSECTYKTLDQSDGLPSSSVLDIYSFEDKIYCATENGVGIIDKKTKFDEQIPFLQIDRVTINERDTTLLGIYKLERDQDNIKISYSSVYYNNPKSIRYKYKLLGLNMDWTETDQTIVQYPSLPGGAYKFLLRSKSLNSEWSPVQSIEFDIAPRFTETFFYHFLKALAIGAIAIFCFSLFLMNREKQRALKVSQLTVLRSQLNPHFIFNSLNSIQYYILNNDKRKANKYISQFSKLMRYTLNSSDNEFTYLDLELQALELYLSIESMRFDNPLDYSFSVDPSIDPKKYKIPVMIIQPYIENAIKHGLIHAKGKKTLRLKVSKMDKGLYFEIIDNGIGRVHSRKINSNMEDKYDSKGTAIIEERIELLNKAYGSKNRVTFEDIYDKQDGPTGTKVKIELQSIKFSP